MLTHVGRLGAAAMLGALGAAMPTSAEGDLRLVDAVKARDLPAVERLLGAGVPVDSATPDGATALHWAAHRDGLEMASRLLRAGADPDVINELGVSPLVLACENASAAMVGQLLAHGADPNQAQPTGVTPLMACARTGSAAAVEALLASGATVDRRESVSGQTALMWAVAERHADVVSHLIAADADVGGGSARGFTPLMFAAQQGDEALATTLLAAGADVDRANNGGSAALLVATESGHLEMVRLLLEAGADRDAAGTGRTALHGAVQHERPDIVTLLLDYGADVDARLTARLPKFAGDLASNTGPGSMVGATPFWLATKFTDVDLMRLFRDRGADTTLAADDGTTPLMVAAGIMSLEGYDRYGRLVFADDTARRREHELDTVELAFSLGGDVAVVNEHGQTAMHGAAYTGNDAVVRFLFERGAVVDVADLTGLTPLGITEGIWISGTFLERPTTEVLLRELGAGRGVVQ
jgi:ankyrin repeat protein